MADIANNPSAQYGRLERIARPNVPSPRAAIDPLAARQPRPDETK